MNVIIYLHGHAGAITFADAKAAGKHNIIFQMMLRYSFLEKLHYFSRTLNVTGAAYTNLNYNHKLHLSKNFCRKEILNSVWCY